MPFKKSHAVYKCFDILDLLARNDARMSISEIAAATGMNKSTAYNMLHSLVDLAVLNRSESKFHLGPKFFMLAQLINYESLLAGRVHPYMKRFSERTGLTASLGIRSGSKLVVLDRTVVPGGIDVISKSKVRPLLDGVHGTAVLALLPDEEIHVFLEGNALTRYTVKTVTDERQYLAKIEEIRKGGIAFDREEYHAGIWAAAVAFQVPMLDTQAVVWIFGLESRVDENDIRGYAVMLRELVDEIARSFNSNVQRRLP